MPFTVSHPAIVLPLKKRWPDYFNLSGLMAGAMAPDLIYFLTVTTQYRGFSHSWTGLIMFCLPAGLLFVAAFHYLFKQHFIFALPLGLDLRLSGLARSKFRVHGLRGWLVLIISVLLGAVSHFFWDSWTHPGGVIAQTLPILTETHRTPWGVIRTTKLLQHASTLIGLVVILYMMFRGGMLPQPTDRLSRRTVARKIRFWIGGIVCGAAGSIAAVWVHAGTISFDSARLPENFYLDQKLGLGFWAGFFWAVCCYTIVRRLLVKSAVKKMTAD